MKIKRNKYHTDDLVINILLSNLEYKESNQILFHKVYDELDYDGRERCDKLLDVLVETKFIKRVDSKNAELTLDGLNVKKMGGWLKYQDRLTKKRKGEIFTRRLKNFAIVVGILFGIWNIIKLYIPNTKSQKNHQDIQKEYHKPIPTKQMDITNNDTLSLK